MFHILCLSFHEKKMKMIVIYNAYSMKCFRWTKVKQCLSKKVRRFTYEMSFTSKSWNITLNSYNLDLPPLKHKISFRHLKQGIQQFHEKFVLAPADKADNNAIVVWRLHYINTLKSELSTAKTCELIYTDEKSVANQHCNEITTKFTISITDSQERLPTFYWPPKLHKKTLQSSFYRKL